MAESNTATLDQDMITDFAKNGLSADNVYATLMDQLGGRKLMAEVSGILGQDIAQFGANLAVKPLLKAIITDGAANSPVLQERMGGLTPQAINTMVDWAVFSIGPVLETKRMVGFDLRIREAVNKSLSLYTTDGGDALSGSSLRNKTPENKVLERVESRIQTQFHENATNVFISALSSTALMLAQEQDKKAIGEKIDEVHQRKISDGGLVEGTPQFAALNDKALDAKSKIDTRSLSMGMFQDDTVEMFGEKVSIYGGSKFNKTTATIGVGAVALSSAKEVLKQGINPNRDNLIAYDLINYLSEYVTRNDVTDGTIDIGKLKAENKKHQFTVIGGDSSVKLADFVEEIFRQHVRDHGGDGIGSRYAEELAQASKQIADAISGKEYDVMTGATMHPIALIDLVGNGDIVAHDGTHVAGEHTVDREIVRSRDKFPFEQHVDNKEYMMELSQSPVKLMNVLSEATPDQRDFMMFVLPGSVLHESLGLDESTIRDAKIRGDENVLAMTKKAVMEFSGVDNDTLTAESLTKHQIHVIHKAMKHVEKAEDQELVKMLRDNSIEGLGFALMSDTQRWSGAELSTALSDDPIIVNTAQAAQDTAAQIIGTPDNLVSDAQEAARMQEGHEVQATRH